MAFSSAVEGPIGRAISFVKQSNPPQSTNKMVPIINIRVDTTIQHVHCKENMAGRPRQ